MILFLVALLGCKNSQGNLSPISVDEIAKQEIGDDFERIDRGDFSLCMSISKSISEKRKTVLVVNKTNGDIQFGPERMNADVHWHTDTQLVIQEYPEVIQDKNSSKTFVYYYDILLKKKIEAKNKIKNP